MGIKPKVVIKYEPKIYTVKFNHTHGEQRLLLCYNVGNEFQFVNLKTAQIMNLQFNSEQEAIEWLYDFSEVQKEEWYNGK